MEDNKSVLRLFFQVAKLGGRTWVVPSDIQFRFLTEEDSSAGADDMVDRGK